MLKILRKILSNRKNKVGFKEKFDYFQKLLAVNDQVHSIMSELSEMVNTGKPFQRSKSQKKLETLLNNTKEIAHDLNKMTNGKYHKLIERVNKIEENCSKLLTPHIYTSNVKNSSVVNLNNAYEQKFEFPYYLPISEINTHNYQMAGGKMSRLGEIRNNLGMAVPRGFCLTSRLFDDFINREGHREKIDEILAEADFEDLSQINNASWEIQTLLISSPIPGYIEDTIYEAYEKTFGEEENVRLAVRSSAVGEDSPKYSFAGLYNTELNVGKEDLINACWEVLISKYSPQSLVYRFVSGLRDEDLPMSVGCIEMKNSVTSGIIFTKDPALKKQGMLINAVRGLGTTAVSGQIEPQQFVVERNGEGSIYEFKPGNLEYMEVLRQSGGVRKIDIPEEERNNQSLSQRQISILAEKAMQLERHFGTPQDIEWTFDHEGKLFILQARPLKMKEKRNGDETGKTIPDDLDTKYQVLIDKSDTASGGITYGKVFKVEKLADLKKFQDESIIVAKKNMPEFAGLMHKVAGLVTDVGNTTGHMSIIAKELNIPVLTNTYKATEVLKHGGVITVNADTGKVYAGKVDELLNTKAGREVEHYFEESPKYKLWQRIGKYIFKLNMTDPNSSKFTSENCQTVHDVSRFAHEQAMREMFTIYESADRDKGDTHRLKFDVPLNVYVIDLGDGLKKDAGKKPIITPDDISSKTFLALIKGMQTPGLEWSGPLNMDTKGFAHIMMRNVVDTHKGDREMGSRSYALISDNYLNFFSRLGYHFSRLDAFAGEEIHNNYIAFNFRGGAAEFERRCRRAKVVKRILEHFNFSVVREDDNINSSIRKIEAGKVYELLSTIGRMMGAIRNTDVTMTSDECIELFVEGFLEGDPAPAKRYCQ